MQPEEPGVFLTEGKFFSEALCVRWEVLGLGCVGRGEVSSSASVVHHTALITCPASHISLTPPKSKTPLNPSGSQMVDETLCENWNISKILMLLWQVTELYATENSDAAGLLVS